MGDEVSAPTDVNKKDAGGRAEGEKRMASDNASPKAVLAITAILGAGATMSAIFLPMQSSLDEMRQRVIVIESKMSEDDMRERSDAADRSEIRSVLMHTKEQVAGDHDQINRRLESGEQWRLDHDLRVVERNATQDARLRSLERINYGPHPHKMRPGFNGSRPEGEK